MNRRSFLKGLSSVAGVSAGAGLSPAAWAGAGRADRVIFLYFPDGVAAQSDSGEASLWHATGSEHDFSLPSQLEPLSARKGDCVFFRGLSMGGTDSGSHPGGAKKLLTATDYGNGESIDQYLARTAGASSPWRHLFLGAQANAGGASSDQSISYPSAGISITPEDDPRRAFEALFGSWSGGSGEPAGPDPRAVSVLDGVLEETLAMRARLNGPELAKLDFHLESLYELEQRLSGGGTTGSGGASCEDPSIDIGGITDENLYSPETFPEILKAQLDLTVLAMECGITRVATVQASYHTSELIMSRWPGTEMYDPGFDMRSHQASHYGASHNYESAEFTHYLAQRRWFVSQYAYLLDELDARGLLDSSLVVLVTEVCDGNTHYHDDMPFVLAGGGGGLRAGRLLDTGYARHGDLWVSLAQAMGQDLWSFGDASGGPLSGLF